MGGHAAGDLVGFRLVLRLQPQRCQKLHHQLHRQVQTQQRVAPFGPHRDDPRGRRQGLAGVEHTLGQSPAGQFQDELRCPDTGGFHTLRVHPALEPIARIAGQFEGAAGRADVQGFKPGGFQQDVGGRGCDLAFQPAHDARDGLRPDGVGDHQHVGLEPVLGAVNGREKLARLGATNDDPTPVELVQIKGVQRLTHLVQNKIGHVHHVVHRPQTDGLQPLLEPVRRGPDLHAPDHPRGVGGAEPRFEVFDTGDLGHGLLTPDSRRGRWNPPQLSPGRRGDLAGDAQVRQAVDPVAGHLHIQGPVVADLFQPVQRETHGGEHPLGFGGFRRPVQVCIEPVQADLHGATS